MTEIEPTKEELVGPPIPLDEEAIRSRYLSGIKKGQPSDTSKFIDTVSHLKAAVAIAEEAGSSNDEDRKKLLNQKVENEENAVLEGIKPFLMDKNITSDEEALLIDWVKGAKFDNWQLAFNKSMVPDRHKIDELRRKIISLNMSLEKAKSNNTDGQNDDLISSLEEEIKKVEGEFKNI